PGTAVRVAVDPSGNPWVVNHQGEIYRWAGNHFERVFGAATDIGVGSDGSVYIVGTDGCDGSGCMIYRRDGAQWTAMSSTGISIPTAARNSAWITNRGLEIFRID